MGVVAEQAPPTYPDGFPAEVVALVERFAGAACSATALQRHHGDRGLRRRAPRDRRG
jgi:hypothetical protein